MQQSWQFSRERTDFGRREAPSAPYVRYLVKTVIETGIVIDKPNRENPKKIAYTVCKALSTSIHRRSQQLNILETSLRLIFHKDLGMTTYKVLLVRELKPIDHPMRFRIAKWACDRLTEDAEFGKKKSSFQMKLIFILAGMSTNGFFSGFF